MIIILYFILKPLFCSTQSDPVETVRVKIKVLALSTLSLLSHKDTYLTFATNYV